MEKENVVRGAHGLLLTLCHQVLACQLELQAAIAIAVAIAAAAVNQWAGRGAEGQTALSQTHEYACNAAQLHADPGRPVTRAFTPQPW